MASRGSYRLTTVLSVAAAVAFLFWVVGRAVDHQFATAASSKTLLYHRHKPVAQMSLRELERFQVRALTHYRGALAAHNRAADRRALSSREWTHRRWYRHAVRWTGRELDETRLRLRPPLAWRQTVAAWLPTYYCERGAGGWATNSGNGYYGGLQFDYGTWLAHGGGQFASRADLASPAQQALVASRLTYDGWPNCPNP